MAEFQVLSREAVRFSRVLTATRDEVWAMLSQGTRIGSWFLPVTEMEARAGGRYIIPTDDGGQTGLLTEFEPPSVINFDGKMRFELVETDGATQLTLHLSRDANGWIPSTLASFEAMLDNLERLLAGEKVYLRAEYMQSWRQYYPMCEKALSDGLAGGGKVVHRVHFPAGGDSALETASETGLQESIALLRAKRSLNVVIDGFADEPLNRGQAFRLSQRRAEWVREELKRGGVAPERMVTRAFGNYYRLFPSRDEDVMRLNRRVEIVPLF